MMGSRGLRGLVFMIFVSSNTYSQSHQSHCDLNFGYHFYCDDGTQAEDMNKEAQTVVEPNEENVKEYMFFQKKVVDNSSNFADVWRRVLWKYPELDYTVK